MNATILIDQIRQRRLDMGWSVFRLAKESGLTESVIRHMDGHYWNPTRKTLDRLIYALDHAQPTKEE